jgi:hypothetical protein
MTNTKVIGIVVLALIIGLVGGYLLHPAPAARTRTAGAYTGTRAAGAGGGFLMGTVAEESSSSITLNTQDGSSHVVLITPSTTVSKYVAGSLSDVAVGSTIVVSGTTNSDGSVSASVIQIRPAVTQTTAPQTTPGE